MAPAASPAHSSPSLEQRLHLLAPSPPSRASQMLLEPLDETPSQHSVLEQPALGLGPGFRGEISNALILVASLRGISNGKRDQRVQVDILADEGLRFTVTDPSKSIQGCASVFPSLFDLFEMRDENVDLGFRVNLAILLDCLTLCSCPTRLRLCFDESQETLAVQLNEGEIVTECTLKTLGDCDDDSLDFAGTFQSASHFNKAIVQSERLRDAFMEISDLSGVSTVKITMSNNEPFFRMTSTGNFGSCDVDFAKETFSQFECQAHLSFEYRLSLLTLATKPLAEAEKTFLRMNSEGMLSFQHLLRQNGQKTYVDYFLLACDVHAMGEEES